ncbi:MAG TPA: class I tRNA ligase family protein [Candidatus Paceibacterota bacterium]
MEEIYDHQQIEPHIADLWEKGADFTPSIDPSKKPFSLFLIPPNASGPMHVGNALMIAVQDILARYHRSLGEPTLWVPSTDHGGYETQVTFERESEGIGRSASDYTRPELFNAIKQFVDDNNTVIKGQIKRLGASVDWTRFRFTMDEASLTAVAQMFKKMVSQDLIYRRPYMVHYCPLCATMLSDIELKVVKEKTTEYFLKFFIENTDDYLVLTTTRPEFLFASTHVLVHPNDEQYRDYIGKTLINPSTGDRVEVIASKRKFDPEKVQPFLSPFSPSYIKYDYEYTLKNNLPSRNLLDWQGKLLDRYPGDTPAEAREKEVAFLQERGLIEKIDDAKEDSVFFCKKEHRVEDLIILTWFLNFDNQKMPLRQSAMDAIKREGLIVSPHWREKGLFEWIGKMSDWPIARQSVWGIKIPIWYEISDPEKFMVWFVDRGGNRLNGNLASFMNDGVSIDEIAEGLERLYAGDESVQWTLNKEPGKIYLPETDSFDTWFSSGQWSTIVFGALGSKELNYFYPSHSIVLGYDLLRLSVSREIVLGQYLMGKLPFKIVYLHRLLKAEDGRKMSKSLGNAVPLEFYIDTYGADATRMALVSYTTEQDDFVFEEKRLAYFKKFASRLWTVGRFVESNNLHAHARPPRPEELPEESKNLVLELKTLIKKIRPYLDRYQFARAQGDVSDFLAHLEGYVEWMRSGNDVPGALFTLDYVYKKYIIVLHPFMPFATEAVNANVYKGSPLLANTRQ